MTYLYHGSTTQHLKELIPHKRYTPSASINYSAIYATPLPAFAAAHSFPWSTNEGVSLNTANNAIVMHVPGAMRDRLQVPISIYKISADAFGHTTEESTGNTWHTTQPVQILEEMKYPSVEIALSELGAKLEYV